MANLTVVIDDQLLQAARLKALRQGTSVNEICRDAIARFARQSEDADEWMAQWRAVVRSIKPRPGGESSWPGREALYDEMLAERGGTTSKRR